MSDFDPYEVLGVAKDASDKQIKAAYRRRASDTHPDKVVKDHASAEAFRIVKDAYQVLIDPDRRKRYDTTGRTDETKVTPARVQAFIKSTMNSVVEAQRPDGSSDDPLYENILVKILMSMKGSRAQIQDARLQTQRKLGRAIILKKKFVPKTEHDPVGEVLQAEIDRLKAEMKSHEDAMELSVESERVFRTYNYELGEVASQAEGQFTRPATVRLPRTFLDP